MIPFCGGQLPRRLRRRGAEHWNVSWIINLHGWVKFFFSTLRSPSLVCKKFTGNCLLTAWGSNQPVSLRVHTTLNEKTLFQLKFIYIHTSFSSLKCTYMVSKALNFLMLRSRIDSCVCDEMSHRKPLLRHDLELYCGRQQCKQAPRWRTALNFKQQYQF